MYTCVPAHSVETVQLYQTQQGGITSKRKPTAAHWARESYFKYTSCTKYYYAVANSSRPQVTAKGFGPLLQFAYTAKLVLSRENIGEVIRCAEVLGVHNLEDSCFRFLQAQLQNDGEQHITNGRAAYDSDGNGEPDEDDDDDGDVVATEEHFLSKAPGVRSTDVAEETVEWQREQGHAAIDLPRCAKYRKYQYQDPQHQNGDGHHGDADGDLVNHTSVGSRSPRPSDNGTAAPPPAPTPPPHSQGHLLTPSRIKEEPFVFEGEGEGGGSSCPPESCAEEEVLEMELEVEGGPVASDLSPGDSGSLPSSCLRSYLQRGGLDLTGVPSTTIQQLLSSRLSLDHYRELARERERDRESAPQSHCRSGDLKVTSLEPANGSKAEVELDRRSVIFSSADGERLGRPGPHAYSSSSERKFTEKELPPDPPKAPCVPSTKHFPSALLSSSSSPFGDQASSVARPRPASTAAPTTAAPTSCPIAVPVRMATRSPSHPAAEPRTRTSSSCSSFSYLEDGGSGGSPSSLPQYDFSSSSPRSRSRSGSGSVSGLARCLAGGGEEQGNHAADAVFTQGRAKIKREHSGYGPNGTNSSDESGSFSEGDSECGVPREPGPEVGLPAFCF